jgi:hypothetical protein
MKIIFKGFIVVLASSATAAITTFVYHKVLGGGVALEEMKYQDFVSISLTALGLMMTILGFFMAAAGILGWATIESKLRDHSISYFKEQLSKNGPLRAEFEQLLSDIAYEGIDNIKTELNFKPDTDYND